MRLVLVLPLCPLRNGDGFALRTWPLHVTVAPTFVTGSDLQTVIATVAPVLGEQEPLRVETAADEGFGRSGRIPVTLIAPSPAMVRLHGRLVEALQALGGVFDDPEFTGTGYRPHVTMTRTNRVHPGEVLDLRQVTMVDMEPEGDTRLRRVVWALSLTARHGLCGRGDRAS